MGRQDHTRMPLPQHPSPRKGDAWIKIPLMMHSSGILPMLGEAGVRNYRELLSAGEATGVGRGSRGSMREWLPLARVRRKEPGGGLGFFHGSLEAHRFSGLPLRQTRHGLGQKRRERETVTSGRLGPSDPSHPFCPPLPPIYPTYMHLPPGCLADL